MKLAWYSIENKGTTIYKIQDDYYFFQCNPGKLASTHKNFPVQARQVHTKTPICVSNSTSTHKLFMNINAIIKDRLLYIFQKYKNDPLLLLSSHTLTCSHIFHKNIFAFGGKYMPYLVYIYIYINIY